jgi:hypothetical protein
MRQRFAVRGVDEEIEIDRRELEDEFAADRFGYQRFLEGGGEPKRHCDPRCEFVEQIGLHVQKIRRDGQGNAVEVPIDLELSHQKHRNPSRNTPFRSTSAL